MAWIGWGVAIAMAIAIGFAGGNATGADRERAKIANECRNIGGFSHNRTGFTCARRN